MSTDVGQMQETSVCMLANKLRRDKIKYTRCIPPPACAGNENTVLDP